MLRIAARGLALGLALLATTAAEAEEKLLLLPLEAEGTSLKAEELVGLSAFLAGRIEQGGRFVVVPARAGAREAGSAEAIAASGAGHVLGGGICRVGTVCLLSLFLGPAAEPWRASAFAARGRCDPEALISLLEPAGAGLARAPAAASASPAILHLGPIESRGAPLSNAELSGLRAHLAALLGGSGQAGVLPPTVALDQRPLEAARAALTHRLVTSITRLGPNCLVTASLIDARKNQAAFTASVKKPCQPEELVEAMAEIAARVGSRLAPPR